VVVLVEGRSDVAAISALLRTSGVDPAAPVELVDMGGVTNIRAHLSALVESGRAGAILGMCDAGEAHWFVRAVQGHGVALQAAADLPDHGFYVCDADLEDELIRALGPEAVLDVFGQLGLTRRFASFSGQEYWRDRELTEQLHRFAGIASGRKSTVAGALAAALTPDNAPAPLRQLVGTIGQALGSPGDRVDQCETSIQGLLPLIRPLLP
jgi:hypothetical protein